MPHESGARARRFHRKSRAAPPGSHPDPGVLAELNRHWRDHIVPHASAPALDVDPSRDHVRGSDEARVTLIEYGDYESPACRQSAAAVHELCDRRGDELRFVFRHFPMTDAHPLSLYAALAAEAAGAQERFWAMHDGIYALDHYSRGREDSLEPATIHALAARIGLDLERFDGDVADEIDLPRIVEDFKSGLDSGVSGTPTFFVNGERLDWNFEIESLEEAVKGA